MVDTSLGKLLFVVLWFIETHHASDVEMLKYLKVVLRRVASPAAVLRVNGAHECNEFVRNNHVHVAILHLLIVLVLLVVELSKVVPAVADADLQPLQALED